MFILKRNIYKISIKSMGMYFIKTHSSTSGQKCERFGVRFSDLPKKNWKRFVFLIFISICLFVVCTLSKSRLADAGRHTVLGPKICGLDFSNDFHLGILPYKTNMSHF